MDATVSVVLITYSRPELCGQALTSLRRRFPEAPWEYIITDDGSSQEVVDQLRRLPADRLITSPHNTGLGANSNRGLRAATGQYILHVEDDFCCQSSEPFVGRAIEILHRHPQVGLVKLHHEVDHAPRQDCRLPDGTPYSILDFDRPPPGIGLYHYSNHPHLKRADFHDQAGYFTEGLRAGETEDVFCYRFLARRPYRVATFWRSDYFRNVGLGRSLRPAEQRSKLRSNLYLRMVRFWSRYLAFRPRWRRC
jgi:hypothetical protein